MNLWEDLITRYVKRKEFLLRDVPVKKGERLLLSRPFITVSREAGSGGKLIAKKVAKALKYEFYNKKLIELTAKKAKKREQLISSLDEKERGLVDDLVHSLLNPNYVSEQTYIKNLCEVILSVARRGNCVILGRGSNFITQDHGGLHIRIVAPFLVRAGNTAQYEKRTIYNARERVRKFDKGRKEFVKQYFGKNPSNANYYDLVLNSTYLTIEQARDIIVAAFKKKFPDWIKYRLIEKKK